MAKAAINVQHVYKTLGQHPVLVDLSLALHNGEVTALVGQNGAGKTTLLRILAGVLTADKGQVANQGKSLAYLAENTPLHEHLTPTDYLSFFARLHGKNHEAVQQIIKDTGIEDLKDKQIGSLSRGQRQLVGLAVTLLPEPDVLLLDEPTSGLDPVQRDRMHKLLVKQAKQRVILLSTHGLEEAKDFCQRMVFLHEGKILADGKPADVLRGADMRAAFMAKLKTKTAEKA